MPKDCKTCQVSKQNSLFLAGLFDKLYRKNNAPEESGIVEITGRKIELNAGLTNESRWRYLVTLRLEDGKETELIVPEDFYNKAKVGLSGTALWQGDHLLRFEETK